MTLDRAYAIIQFYGEEFEIRNLWEVLAHMEKNINNLDTQERIAYNMINKDLKNELTTVIEDDGYAD